MAKKKEQSKDIKSILITVGVVVVSIAILSASNIVYAFGTMSNWIGKIDSEKIMKDEYNYNLYQEKVSLEGYAGTDIWGFLVEGKPYSQKAKESVFDAVVVKRISLNESKKLGFTLTDKDKEEAKTNMTTFKETQGEDVISKLGLTDDEILVIEENNILARKYQEHTSKDFVLDQSEFDTYFTDYVETNKYSLSRMQGDVIVADTKDVIESAKAELDAGADFVETYKKYSTTYSADVEYTQASIDSSALPEDIVRTVYDLPIGSVTDVIENEAKFYIVRLNSKEEINEAELKVTQEETFINSKKSELFSAELEKIYTELKIKRNEPLFESIDVTKLGGKTPEVKEEAVTETTTAETKTEETKTVETTVAPKN